MLLDGFLWLELGVVDVLSTIWHTNEGSSRLHLYTALLNLASTLTLFIPIFYIHNRKSFNYQQSADCDRIWKVKLSGNHMTRGIHCRAFRTASSHLYFNLTSCMHVYSKTILSFLILWLGPMCYAYYYFIIPYLASSPHRFAQGRGVPPELPT